MSNDELRRLALELAVRGDATPEQVVKRAETYFAFLTENRKYAFDRFTNRREVTDYRDWREV